jgi:hypothetical protein
MYVYIYVCVRACVRVCVCVCVCVCVGGGVDSITLVQPKAFNPKAGVVEKTLFKHPVYKALWMPMIDTADLVAER